jgi:hypothetical protein
MKVLDTAPEENREDRHMLHHSEGSDKCPRSSQSLKIAMMADCAYLGAQRM